MNSNTKTDDNTKAKLHFAMMSNPGQSVGWDNSLWDNSHCRSLFVLRVFFFILVWPIDSVNYRVNSVRLVMYSEVAKLKKKKNRLGLWSPFFGRGLGVISFVRSDSRFVRKPIERRDREKHYFFRRYHG